MTSLTICSSAAAQLIVNPRSEIAGNTIGDLILDWAIWAASEPLATSPLTDETGGHQHLHQQGNVWFLPTDFGPAIEPEGLSRELTFRVPSDKFLFTSTDMWWSCSDFVNPADADWVRDVVSRAHISFSIDGVSLSDETLKANHRAESGVRYWELTGPNILGEEDASGFCAYGGHWVALAPLTHGEHIIQKVGQRAGTTMRWEWTFNVLSVLPGDFDDDGDLTAGDIDVLSNAIIQRANDVYSDLNGDGILNQQDHAYWVNSLANTLPGDANLNGAVDFADFLLLSAGFGQDGGWAQGDFNGSLDVTFEDFLVLSANFGKERPEAVVSVPEPSGMFCITTLTLLGSLRIRRR